MSSHTGTPDILTQSGLFFSYIDISPDRICIEDIAHGLSHVCRFAGHTRHFYSVAEHSVRVARLCPNHTRAALLHDAAEAYMGDMPRPLKRLLPEYKAIELQVQRAIFEKFDLPFGIPEEVKRADEIMLATEGRDLCHRNWDYVTLQYPPLEHSIGGTAPYYTAKKLFLSEWEAAKT